MRYFFVLLIVFTISSCDYFKVKKTSSEAILKEELQTFDWNDVDAYPSFSKCDGFNSKEEKRRCFEETLTSRITAYLQEQLIVVTEDVNDTLILEFEVSNNGALYLKEMTMDSVTKQQIPEMEKFLYQSLDSLPKIFPAIKRGQQVTTSFELPLIVKVE